MNKLSSLSNSKITILLGAFIVIAVTAIMSVLGEKTVPDMVACLDLPSHSQVRAWVAEDSVKLLDLQRNKSTLSSYEYYATLDTIITRGEQRMLVIAKIAKCNNVELRK